MGAKKPEEIIIQGLPGSKGLAIGSVLVLDEKRRKVKPKKIKLELVARHLKRFTEAKKKFLTELNDLSSNHDAQTANILETQKHIVSDNELEVQVFSSIKEHLFTVDFSIYQVLNQFIERLKESGSELFQQRIIDIENIRDRLIALATESETSVEIEKGAILVVKDISPTDLVSFYDKGVKGLVMDRGGVTSHASIIAQSLNIPCIINTKSASLQASEARRAIVDAENGVLILNPAKEKVQVYKQKIKKNRELERFLKTSQELPQTKDEKEFYLRANIEFSQELVLANRFKADGVGLLRTEALLFGGLHKKSEEEQDLFYESILAGISGVVTIRLFDVGGDKLLSNTMDEANPFLGWRGIRMLLDEKEMFLGQLRSILKCAGKYPGRVKVLVPMISVLEEIQEVKSAINHVQASLKESGIPIDEEVRIGIMIEVPSAALIANHLAKEVDFFSIGTNDLTQYTLAVDRGNEKICELYQQHHPAVWQLIKLARDAAFSNNIEVCVCGELAGDILGASCLVGMGITDLSMSPASIPKVKEVLIKHTSDYLESLSNKILAYSSTEEVKNLYDMI